MNLKPVAKTCLSQSLLISEVCSGKLAKNTATEKIIVETVHKSPVTHLGIETLVRLRVIRNPIRKHPEKYTKKSTTNSSKNIWHDIEVCHPSLVKAKGNPIIIVSGASTGKTYHHFVIVPNRMIVNGKTSSHINCLSAMMKVSDKMTNNPNWNIHQSSKNLKSAPAND